MAAAGLRLATWNVNSVKARLANLTDWLRTQDPDVVVLQELKCEADAFPEFELRALGYHCHVAGQKSYNGVALLSKQPAEDVITRLPGGADDHQARYIEATVAGLRIGGLYAPNGNGGEDKYTYKLAWMDRLLAHARTLLAADRPFLLGGDYNIIPEAEDCHDPAAWAEDALFRLDSRRAWRRLVHLGLTDAFRAVDSRPHIYSFWDYQARAWQRDAGIRIDHWLVSSAVADRLAGCVIDREPRGRDKASDHTPVMVTLTP